MTNNFIEIKWFVDFWKILLFFTKYHIISVENEISK